MCFGIAYEEFQGLMKYDWSCLLEWSWEVFKLRSSSTLIFVEITRPNLAIKKWVHAYQSSEHQSHLSRKQDIATHLHWVGLHNDASQFCVSCHVKILPKCTHAAKPKKNSAPNFIIQVLLLLLLLLWLSSHIASISQQKRKALFKKKSTT